MMDLTFGRIFKAVIVSTLSVSILSGIGYLTLVVIRKKTDLETKLEKQEKEIKRLGEQLGKKTLEVQHLEDIIALLDEWESVTTTPENREKEIKLLEEKLEEKTAEVRYLEALLTPFRDSALEYFPGDEKDALMKLANRIKTKTLEEKVRKHKFIPLSKDIRTQIVKQLSGLQRLYKKNNIHIELTHETWTPPTTRKYANQMALILAESGLNVTGPGFATVVYTDNQSFPLEWGYNIGQEKLINKLFAIFYEVQSCKNFAVRKDLSPGRIRIHIAGNVTFDSQGRVLFE